METLILIVLLVHVIALLGVLGTAKHSTVSLDLDLDADMADDWHEARIPARVAMAPASAVLRSVSQPSSRRIATTAPVSAESAIIMPLVVGRPLAGLS